MSQDIANDSLSILELPGMVASLFKQARRPLLPGATGPVGLFVRYLRRKPERGLAIIFNVDEIQANGKATPDAKNPERAVSLTIDEEALDGSRIRFGMDEAARARVVIEPSGILHVSDLWLSVQTFPADEKLPGLAQSCDTSAQSALFALLEGAARAQLGDASWRLIAARAEPVRYKPASRCVIRYRLILERRADEQTLRRDLTLFGKVYSDSTQARVVHERMQQLYAEQSEEGAPFLPRPLGRIEDNGEHASGFTLSEAVQPADPSEPLLTGTRALRAVIERGRGGALSRVVAPVEELRLTASALAKLHTSQVSLPESTRRTGAKEAKRARDRASLIAARNPTQAEEVQELAQQLARHLEELQPDAYRPAHGGFKASQLLFHSHRVFVVDFDGFCLADPALDVGYFLAYLRPSGLWYERPGMHEWFRASAEVFTDAYRQAMQERGIASESVDGILKRSRLYEAALLFKIATRRVNRLNSPRPKELSAMLREIAACLPGEVSKE